MTYLHTINEESQETQPLHKKLNLIFSEGGMKFF